jgi:hypothetical protein
LTIRGIELLLFEKAKNCKENDKKVITKNETKNHFGVKRREFDSVGGVVMG